MSDFVRIPVALALLVATLALVVSPPAVAAPSKAQASVEALTKRMETAEADYRSALVLIANADAQGQVQADKAIEDMEDVIDACMKQRGCSVSTMLATYKRLLKLGADEAGGEYVVQAEDDHGDHVDDHRVERHDPVPDGRPFKQSPHVAAQGQRQTDEGIVNSILDHLKIPFRRASYRDLIRAISLAGSGA